MADEQYKQIRTPDGIIHRFPADATADDIDQALNPLPPKYGPETPGESKTQYGLRVGGSVLGFGTDRYTPRTPQEGETSGPSLYNAYLKTKQGLGEGWEGIKQTFQHPIESFKHDPVGTVSTLSLPGGILHGGYRGLRAGYEALPEGRVKGTIGGAASGATSPIELPITRHGAARAITTSPVTGGAYLLGHHFGGVEGGMASAFIADRLMRTAQGALQGGREGRLKGLGPTLGPEAPPAVPKVSKQISTSTLDSALKNNIIAPEEHTARLVSLGHTPEDAAVMTKNAMIKEGPSEKITLGETPKKLSLGDAKSAVKAGMMSMDDFNQYLTEAGFNESHRAIMTNLLSKSIEEDAATEKEAAAKKEEAKPKPKTVKPKPKPKKKAAPED